LSLCLSTAPAPTEIYTLSLHDALPISRASHHRVDQHPSGAPVAVGEGVDGLELRVDDCRLHQRVDVPARGEGAQVVDRRWHAGRSEEHTSELQSRENLVCRLLLEKKKQ